MAFKILILFSCMFYKKSQRFLCFLKTKLRARIGVASDGLVKPRLVRLPGMDRASNLFLMCPLYMCTTFVLCNVHTLEDVLYSLRILCLMFFFSYYRRLFKCC
jgi:hypothetical protein